jgi:hypothetical protein
VRSHAWLKLKPNLAPTVTIIGGSSERTTWGDLGRGRDAGVPLYTHPRTGAEVEIHQAFSVPRGDPLDFGIGQRAKLICWGVMPSGMLRHPAWWRTLPLHWLPSRPP